MRKALTMTVAGLVLAGCGGSSLPEQDKSLAEEFWTSLSSLERETLCERMATASGRLASAKSLSDELPTMEPNGNPADIVKQAKELEANDARAEAIVTYFHEDKC